MAGTLRINLTKNSAELASVRHAYLWSAWFSGTLLGKGYCARPEEGIARAHDLASPDQVEHIEIVEG